MKQEYDAGIWQLLLSHSSWKRKKPVVNSRQRIPAFIIRQFFEFCTYISAIGCLPMQVNGFLILNIILKSWILKKRVFTALFYKLFFMVVICIKHTEWTKVDSIKNWNWLLSKTKYFYFSSLNKTWQIESNQGLTKFSFIYVSTLIYLKESSYVQITVKNSL